MGKKRILITMTSMYIGGAERALLGLLNAIDTTKNDIDLLIYSHEGEFMPLIPNTVNLLPYDSRFDVFANPIKTLFKRGSYCVAFDRIMAKIHDLVYCKIHGVAHCVWHQQQLNHKYLIKQIPQVKGKYDLAICFIGVPSIIVKRVDANVKIGWVHTDYSKLIFDKNLDRKMYSQLSYIVNVSIDTKKIFDLIYPEYKNKSIVIENIHSSKWIRSMAAGSPNDMVDDGRIKFLSVGRFGYAKNFDNVPFIVALMKEWGASPLVWYLVGGGPDETLIRKNIAIAGVENCVKIIGMRSNPYPYIKACDVYVQPSRFEGKAITVTEAQILGKPVVVANYATASSQVTDGVNGYIVPQDNEECASALVNLLKDKEKLVRIVEYCQSHEFGNESEINKIMNLIQ